MTEDEALAAFASAAKALPGEGHWIEAGQELAALIARHAATLGDDRATLIGIGALIYRQGFREFQAGLHTDLLFKRVKGTGDE